MRWYFWRLATDERISDGPSAIAAHWSFNDIITANWVLHELDRAKRPQG
jgi:hypothetical protein